MRRGHDNSSDFGMRMSVQRLTSARGVGSLQGPRTGSRGRALGRLGRGLLAGWLLAMLAPVTTGAQSEVEEIEPVANIERAARSFLRKLADADSGAELEVRVDAVDPRLRLKRCDLDLETSLGPGARPVGNTTVKVLCQAPARWSLFVTARVERFGDVVVVAAPINRGEIVTLAHLRVERRATGDLFNGFFAAPSAVIGKQVARSLKPGEVVTDAHLRVPLMVERGQLVRLVSEGGGIRVSVSGEALEDGHAGQRIRVRNSSSKRVLEGLVESPGVIRIPM